MEQRFAIKKKELIDVYYTNADETEVLRFTVYRAVCRSKRKEHFLVIHRYKSWLYTDDFTQKTLYREINMVGYTIGEAVQALKQALKKHVTDMVIDSLWIIDKNLQRRAGITFEEKLEERLEKLFNTFQA